MQITIIEQITLKSILNFWFLGRPLLLWLIALGIIILSFILKRLFGLIITKLISGVITKRSSMKPEHESQFKSIISWLLPLLAFKISLTGILWANPNVTWFVNKILTSVLIVIILMIAELICRELFSYLKAENPEKLTDTVHRFMIQIIKAVLIVLGIIMILSLFEINVSGILTGLGLGGLAVSMAAKDYLTDLIAGFSIMSEKTFELGDHITSPEVEGVVTDIKFRQTALRGLDQSMIYVPNSKLIEEYVINYTRRGKRRIRLMIFLPLIITNDQIMELKQILAEYISGNSAVTIDNPILATYSITETSIEFLVQYYIKNTSFEDFTSEQEQILQLIWSYLVEKDLAEPFTRIEFMPEQIADKT